MDLPAEGAPERCLPQKAGSGHESGPVFNLLADSTDGDESSGIRSPGYSARSNQRLKPDILRDALRGRNAERGHELTPIFVIREEPAGRFRSLLLKTLEREHAPIVGYIWKKRNGGVILAHRSCPPQALVFRLLTG